MKVHLCLPRQSAVLILLTIACEGMRGETSRRADWIETNWTYFEEGGRIDRNESGSDPYMEDFHRGEYLKPIHEGVKKPGKKERPHHPVGKHKPKKVPKKKDTKQKGKGPKDKHKGKSKETKSPMPTMSAQPSVSPAPSAQPSVSPAPTITPKPTATAKPTSPAIVKRPANELAGENANERVNKFAILYELQANANTSREDYNTLAAETSQYLDEYLKEYYDDIDEVIFLNVGLTSWFEPSPLVVDYDAVSYFNSSSVPTTEELDGLIWNAFSSESAEYLAFLAANLSPTNPFSKPKSIKFSPYWTALAAQKSQASQEEPIASGSAKVVAPVVAVGASMIVFAGLLVFEHHRRRTAAIENGIEYSQKSSNLHILRDHYEEDTMMLDEQSVSGRSHKSRPQSTLEEDDGEFIDQSPADVMKEMNLTSALEDVDLDDRDGAPQDRTEC